MTGIGRRYADAVTVVDSALSGGRSDGFFVV
jgi:hypothetical protein